MPVDYKNYPLDWFTRIRPSILERAKNCCEECGVSNYSLVTQQDRETIWNYETYAEAKLHLSLLARTRHDDPERVIIIVLTIAHLDHFPMNNDPANLRAFCQKCHNTHDAKHRAKTRREKRLAALEEIAPSFPLVTSTISKI